jgi:hypothetical protein
MKDEQLAVHALLHIEFNHAGSSFTGGIKG